jgi:hypothetical protein
MGIGVKGKGWKRSPVSLDPFALSSCAVPQPGLQPEFVRVDSGNAVGYITVPIHDM